MPGLKKITTKKAHCILLAVGFLFLLTNAFHGNIWFDESYSVGIAAYDFKEIWSIGSYDVHPVLYYCALHILYLIFGTNILVYRIFTLLGAVALAALGYTHLRKDFGPLVGFLFSFLVFFTPYVAFMAVQIRMYSWVIFTVMLCGIYGYRIGKRALDNNGSKLIEKTPVHWWIIFAFASLASAYLQYFGTISVFVINFMLLLALVAAKKPWLVAAFFGQAAFQVLAYTPWLLVLMGQMGVVGGENYWAEFTFPDTIRELISYPVTTLQVVYSSWFFDHGIVVSVFLISAVVALIVSSVVVGICAIQMLRKMKLVKQTTLEPGFIALLAYVGLLAIGFIAGGLMDSYIMYYRYAFVCIGPFIFFMVCVLVYVARGGASLATLKMEEVNGAAFEALKMSEVKDASLESLGASGSSEASSGNLNKLFKIGKKVVVSTCISLLIVATFAQGLSIVDDYSEMNKAPLNYFLQEYTIACGYQENQHLQDEGESVLENENNRALVLSSDIGVQGVLAIEYPEIKQTYLDWQKGNWAKAYEAYGDKFVSVKSYDEVLDTYEGMFVVVGQSKRQKMPRDITDLENREDVELVESEIFFRPYERTFFTVALFKTVG